MAYDWTSHDTITAADTELLRRALTWKYETPDREIAIWADRFAQDVAAWCEKNRGRLVHRAPEIVKALTPYLGLPKVLDVVERVTGQTFH